MQRERHHFAVGVQVSRRRVPGRIANDTQSPGRCVVPQTALLHFAGAAIQGGVLDEELGRP